MEDEAIFLNKAPLRDLLSMELCEVEHYCDDTFLLRRDIFCSKLFSNNEVDCNRD